MKKQGSALRTPLVPVALWLLLFLVSCKWQPYIQKDYEGLVGQRQEAKKDEALLSYESGLLMKYDDSKRGAVSSKLYYMGMTSSALEFLWQRYDLSTFSASSKRTLEKSPVAVDLQPFPFQVNIRGFNLLIHEADTGRIAFTLVSAEPTDIPDTTELMKLAPR